MRAKTINEIQHFERNLDPKQFMDIGGIDIPTIYREIMKEPLKKWSEFVKSFEGKIISGKFIKKDKEKWEEVEAIIKVDKAFQKGLSIDFYTKDFPGICYTPKNNTKIRIKEKF